MKANCPKKGFSLIEMLIVIAIIGLLASLVIPNILHIYYKGRATKIVTDLRAIRDVALSYHSDYGTWPRSRGWGRIPPEFRPHLPPATSFGLPSWDVRYAYTNYSKKSQRWKARRAYSVVIRARIENIALANVVARLAPNLFAQVRINKRRGVFFVALE